MIYDNIHFDENGKLQCRKEEDFIIDDAEWSAERLAEWMKELDKAIEEYMREYAEQTYSSDESI